MHPPSISVSLTEHIVNNTVFIILATCLDVFCRQLLLLSAVIPTVCMALIATLLGLVAPTE